MRFIPNVFEITADQQQMLASPNPERDVIASGASGIPDQSTPLRSTSDSSPMRSDTESHSELDEIHYDGFGEVRIQVQALLERAGNTHKTGEEVKA